LHGDVLSRATRHITWRAIKMSGINQVEECVKIYFKNLLDQWGKAETDEQKETLMGGIVKVVGSILDIKRM